MIRFVYFDLGNVLIRFSVQRMLHQVAALVEKPEAEIRSAFFDDKRYFAYEKGEIDAKTYFSGVCELLNVTVAPEDFLRATNDIFWVNDPILPIIRKLARADFPRGVLSNTNPAHWAYLETAFPLVWKRFPRHKLASFAVKAVKPFPEIYRIALDEARTELPDLRPEEVLLIDDLEDNVKGAAEFGFQTFHYAENAPLVDALRAWGLPTPD